MRRRWGLLRSAAVLVAAVIGAQMCHVSAAEEDAAMSFRLTASQNYLTASQVAEGDVVLRGAMYIDNYTAINMMRLVIGSDEGIVIENGAFSDPNFLEGDYAPDTSQNVFNSYSETHDVANLITWYGPGALWEDGAVADENASFVEFDIRIPQGTAPGRYNIYFDQRDLTLSSGLKFPLFTVYCEAGKYGQDDRPAVAVENCFVTIEPSALRGDVTCDGIVDPQDAIAVLRFYTDYNVIGAGALEECLPALNELYPHTAYEAADADLSSACDTGDAIAILQYYTSVTLLEMDVTWEDVLG